ncbi:MAG: hypothetical protein OSJ62_09045 [Lachnospiraceae bacterium]|nr:hypothetical protein [Lachnospiraceae bacterium]
MSKLKQKAIQIIENMPEDLMSEVISSLKTIESEKNLTLRSMEGLKILQSFAGTLPSTFHYTQELEEAREEKYDRFY